MLQSASEIMFSVIVSGFGVYLLIVLPAMNRNLPPIPGLAVRGEGVRGEAIKV